MNKSNDKITLKERIAPQNIVFSQFFCNRNFVNLQEYQTISNLKFLTFLQLFRSYSNYVLCEKYTLDQCAAARHLQTYLINVMC